VQLAHPGDERLPRLLVRLDAEGRILLGQPREPGPELVLVSPVVVDLRPTPAAISPAMISSRSSRWFACIWRMRPTRSVRPVMVLSTRSPALSVPE
jgi:hypothetical protein